MALVQKIGKFVLTKNLQARNDFFDLFIEAPLQAFLEFFDKFTGFVREKKEDVTS